MTLVELMISAALFMIVMGGIMSALDSISRSSMVAADDADISMETRRFAKTFGDDVRTSTRIHTTYADEVKMTISEGSQKVEVRYAFNADAGTVSRTVGGEVQKLLDEVDSFEIKYLKDEAKTTPFADEVRIVETQIRFDAKSARTKATSDLRFNARFFRRTLDDIATLTEAEVEKLYQ